MRQARRTGNLQSEGVRQTGKSFVAGPLTLPRNSDRDGDGWAMAYSRIFRGAIVSWVFNALAHLLSATRWSRASSKDATGAMAGQIACLTGYCARTGRFRGTMRCCILHRMGNREPIRARTPHPAFGHPLPAVPGEGILLGGVDPFQDGFSAQDFQKMIQARARGAAGAGQSRGMHHNTGLDA